MEKISKIDFDNYLISQGYNLIKTLTPSSRYISLSRKKKQNLIIKRDHYDDFQTIGENKILTKFEGLDRIPKKIKFETGISKRIKITDNNKTIKDYFLVQEYIEGTRYDSQQLSKKEEQKLIDLVNTFHKEGYSRLDFKPKNLILTPEKEVYFIDLGWLKQRFFFSFLSFKKQKKKDLENLEKILRRSLRGDEKNEK